LENSCPSSQAGDKILPVSFVNEYLSSFYSSPHDMVQNTRGLPAIASSGEAGGHLVLMIVAYNKLINKLKIFKAISALSPIIAHPWILNNLLRRKL